LKPLPIKALPIANQMTYTKCDANTSPLNKQIKHINPMSMFNHSQVRHISLLLYTHITQQSSLAKAKKKKKKKKFKKTKEQKPKKKKTKKKNIFKI